MSPRDRLVAFVEQKIAEKRLVCELTDATSLIRSSLFDSHDLVELATWIEQEMDPGVDLSMTEIDREWDTVPDILRFIAAHRGGHADGS